jgi:hypothetical protein
MFFTLIYFKSRLGASVIIHCFTNISLYYVWDKPKRQRGHCL